MTTQPVREILNAWFFSPPHVKTAAQIQTKWCAWCATLCGPLNHKSAGEDAQCFDIMAIMHHRGGTKKGRTAIYRIQTLTSSVESRFESVHFSWWVDSIVPALLCAFFSGVTQAICEELVHNMASRGCASRCLRAGCCCWRLAALQVM